MTAPLCVECHREPVKRARSSERITQKFGERIVDGVRWRWFCGRSCAGSSSVRLARRSPKLVQWHADQRQAHLQRRLKTLIAILGEHATADGLVPVKTFVALIAKRERVAYAHGVTQGRYLESRAWRKAGAA